MRFYLVCLKESGNGARVIDGGNRMKILVDSLPTDTEPCLFSECQRSGNRTCWFCDHVFVCDPKNCKFIECQKDSTTSKEYGEI